MGQHKIRDTPLNTQTVSNYYYSQAGQDVHILRLLCTYLTRTSGLIQYSDC